MNKLDTSSFTKSFYDKPKFNTDELCIDVTNQLNALNIREDLEKDIELDISELKMDIVENKLAGNNKMADAFLSGVKEEIRKCEDTNRVVEGREREKAVKEIETMVPRKKEKMEVDNVKKVRIDEQVDPSQTTYQSLLINLRGQLRVTGAADQA